MWNTQNTSEIPDQKANLLVKKLKEYDYLVLI